MSPYASSSSPPSWVHSSSPRLSPRHPSTSAKLETIPPCPKPLQRPLPTPDTSDRHPSTPTAFPHTHSRTNSPGRQRRFSVADKNTKTVLGFAFAPRPHDAGGGVCGDDQSNGSPAATIALDQRQHVESNRRVLNPLIIPSTQTSHPHSDPSSSALTPHATSHTPDLLLPSPFSSSSYAQLSNGAHRSSQHRHPQYLFSPNDPRTPQTADVARAAEEYHISATPSIPNSPDTDRSVKRSSASASASTNPKAVESDRQIGSSEEEESIGKAIASPVSSHPQGSAPPVSLLTALLQQHQQSTSGGPSPSSPSITMNGASRRTSGVTFGNIVPSAGTSEDEAGIARYRTSTAPVGIMVPAQSRGTGDLTSAPSTHVPIAPPILQSSLAAASHHASDSGLEAVDEGVENQDDDDVDPGSGGSAHVTPMIVPRSVGTVPVVPAHDGGLLPAAHAIRCLQQQQEIGMQPWTTSLSRQSSITKSILIKDTPKPASGLEPSTASALAPEPAATLHPPNRPLAAERSSAPPTSALPASPARAPPLPISAPVTPAKPPRTSCIKFVVAQPAGGETGPSATSSRRPSQVLEHPRPAHVGEDGHIAPDRVLALHDKFGAAFAESSDGSRSEREDASDPASQRPGVKYCEGRTRHVRSTEMMSAEVASDGGAEDDDEDENEQEDEDEDEDDNENELASESEPETSETDGSASGYEEDSEAESDGPERDPRPAVTSKESRPLKLSPVGGKLGSPGGHAATFAGSALRSACWRLDRQVEGASRAPAKFHLRGSYSDEDDLDDNDDEPPPTIVTRSNYPFARPTHYRRRRPRHSDSFDQVADLHLGSPSSYVKIDPKERTHHGRGLVSIMDAAPPERVDRNICSRHSSPPPRPSRSRTSSSGREKIHRRGDAVPACQSPSANHLKLKGGLTDGSRSEGKRTYGSRKADGAQMRNRIANRGNDALEAAGGSPVHHTTRLCDEPPLVSVSALRLGGNCDDNPAQHADTAPNSSASASSLRRASASAQASTTKQMFRRASETLSTLARTALFGPGPSSTLVGDNSYSDALMTGSDAELPGGNRMAPTVLDSTPAYAKRSRSIGHTLTAGIALHQALVQATSDAEPARFYEQSSS